MCHVTRQDVLGSGSSRICSRNAHHVVPFVSPVNVWGCYRYGPAYARLDGMMTLESDTTVKGRR
jgi:hypothetical protein